MTHPGAAGPPALRLLLAAARPGGGEPGELAAAAAAVTDWETALELAAAHGLLPQLAARLPAGAAAPPAPTRERLRRAALAAASRAARLLDELARVHALLAAAGAPAVPWKGPVGALQAHGDAALRHPEDLDLLLRARDARRALAALRAEGYRPLAAVRSRRELALLEERGSLTLEHPGRGVRLDLATSFWRPAFRHPFAPEALLPRARPLGPGAAGLPALPAEETLLALAVHGATHRWERLAWAADLAALAARGPDWDRAFAEARRLRVLRALAAGLGVAAALFGLPLPPPARQALAADPAAAALAREGAAAARAGPGAPGTLGAGLDELRFQLHALATRGDRAAFLWRAATVPNPNDEAWAALPAPLAPALRLLRPLRLALRHGPRLLGAARRAARRRPEFT